MAAIAAGKGRGPKPFMLRGSAPAAAAAVWDSRKGAAAEARAKNASHTKPVGRAAGKAAPRGKMAAGGATTGATLPAFVAPQLCESVERPPSGAGWVHEIKFDGYRMQLRVAGGTVTLKTRKGLDWTARFGAIARAASGFPDALIDGEIVALDRQWGAGFRRAAGGAVRAGHRRPDLLCFRFAVRWEHRPPPVAVERTQATAGVVSWREGSCLAPHPLCGAFRNERRRRAAVGLPPVVGGNRLEAARCALCLRAGRRAGPRRNAAPGTRW